MALTVLETYEYEENGNTYIYTKYQRKDGGITEERRIKSDPAPIGPEEPQPVPVTNEDIMAQLQAMQGDQVPQQTLDTAYTEGVNAYV